VAREGYPKPVLESADINASTCHSGARVSANPESRDSGFSLRLPRNDT
jgi:hypothetical protein